MLFISCNQELKEWEEAKEVNSSRVFEVFLSDYPNSPFRDSAKLFLFKLYIHINSGKALNYLNDKQKLDYFLNKQIGNDETPDSNRYHYNIYSTYFSLEEINNDRIDVIHKFESFQERDLFFEKLITAFNNRYNYHGEACEIEPDIVKNEYQKFSSFFKSDYTNSDKRDKGFFWSKDEYILTLYSSVIFEDAGYSVVGTRGLSEVPALYLVFESIGK